MSRHQTLALIYQNYTIWNTDAQTQTQTQTNVNIHGFKSSQMSRMAFYCGSVSFELTLRSRAPAMSHYSACILCSLKDLETAPPQQHTYASALYFGTTDLTDMWNAHECWEATSQCMLGVTSYCIKCCKTTWRTSTTNPVDALICSDIKKNEMQTAADFLQWE